MIPVTEENILSLLKDSPAPLTKRELVSAFGLKGEEQRLVLKRLLKQMEQARKIVKQPNQAYAPRGAMEEVCIVAITGLDENGEALARPVDTAESGAPPPRITLEPAKKGTPAPGIGARALVRLKRLPDGDYHASIIRLLNTESGRVLGLLVKTKGGYKITPSNKKSRTEFEIAEKDLNGAKPGELVTGEVQPSRGAHRPRARVLDVIGSGRDPKAISLIALHEAGLRPAFPKDVLAATKNMAVPPLEKREDLRHIPLVTIDGADARDFDDAVFAERDGSGFHLIVAIADVSFYVRPGTILNKEAYRRGNSTYFPDRVVPMLPEGLSNDLCSLRPDEDRACLAAHLWINGSGRLERHKFVRGLMRSAKRFTYEEIQAASDARQSPLLDSVIDPLYAAWRVLDAARLERGALDLDIPERKIILNEHGEMTGVAPRTRLDSHRLIEEFMVLANVAAAQALEAKHAPCLYRIHDKPSVEKLESVSEFVESFGLSLPKGQVSKAGQINAVLQKASAMPYGHLIHMMLLRAQMQAVYHPDNIGHFGLALQRYAHFTSPIRRYADLIVHRSLVRAYNLGPGELSDEETVRMEEIADHISQTERTSAEAERNTIDRFAAAFLSEQAGATFTGQITGVTRFGLFVRLDESGADGLVPIRTLPHDFYIHDEKQHALIGRRGGLVYRLGANVRVALVQADPVSGATQLEILGEGADLPGIPLHPPTGGGPHRRGHRKGPGRNGPSKSKFRGEFRGKKPGNGRPGGGRGQKKR